MPDVTVQTRAAKLLQIYTLVSTGEVRSYRAACEQVGVPERTFRTWRKDTAIMEVFNQMVAEQRQIVSGALIDAWPQAVSRLIKKVTGEERISDNAWVAAFAQFRELITEIQGVGSPENEEKADQYLNEKPRWLNGAASVTVKMEDGATVTVKAGQPTLDNAAPPIIENSSLLPAPSVPEDSQR